MRNKITVVGIDPGSSDKGTAYVEITLVRNRSDWRMDSIPVPDTNVSPTAFKEKLTGWKERKDSALLVWDAPLTGPHFDEKYKPDSVEVPLYESGDFTRRDIEKELQSILDPNRTDACNEFPGISVLGYGSGCPHMPITQHMLGLPRMGRFHADYDDLPFKLLSTYQDLIDMETTLAEKACVVETHPAVAMWGWLQLDLEHSAGLALIRDRSSWRYKGSKLNENLDSKVASSVVRECLLNALMERWRAIVPDLANLLEDANPKSIRNKAIEDDNIFDALIAAVLGVLAVTNNKAVKLYGSLSAGAMLLPVTEDFDKALGELSAR
jgi:hypothetical protein